MFGRKRKERKSGKKSMEAAQEGTRSCSGRANSSSSTKCSK